MTDTPQAKELNGILKDYGVNHDPDWMSIILFARNLVPSLSIFSDEKKAEIQLDICEEIAKRDFTPDRYEAILAMLEMHIMQNIGTLELEEALAREKRSGQQLLNEMADIITSMQGVNERQVDRLNNFRETTVEIIQDSSKKSMILTRVRDVFQEIIQEFKAEAKELNAKASYFEQTANFDPLLTSLYNRRALDSYLEEATKDQKAEDLPLCAMMIDVDHFKNVNDTHGHQTGDDVLRALARIIKAHATHYSGFAARYGGEELVVAVKGLDLSNAAIKAEAIRSDVENYDFRARTNGRLSEDSLQFTVSIGVAQWREGWSSDDLINAADSAMYTAKDSGRNKVCTYKDK